MRFHFLLLIPLLCLAAVGRAFGEAGWDPWGVHAKSGELLDKGDFEGLEALAAQLKANGFGILHEQPELGGFYGGLKLADDAPATAWPDRLAVIGKWRAQFPESLTAKIAEANWYLGYPFGYYIPAPAPDAPLPEPFTVGPQPIDCVAKAADLLKAIPPEKIDDPEYYVDLIKICTHNRRPQGEMFDALAKGTALAPGYDSLYMDALDYLEPVICGKKGQLEQQIKEWANRFPGMTGDAFYGYLLMADASQYDLSFMRAMKNIDYARAKRGLLHRLGENDPAHWRDANTLAFLAANACDQGTARQMFLAIEGSAEIDRFRGKKEYMTLRAECGAKTMLDEAYSLERAGRLADAEKRLLSYTTDPGIYLPLEFFYERQGLDDKLQAMKVTFIGKTVREMAALDPGFAPADLLGEMTSYFALMGKWDKAEIAATRFSQLRPENIIGKNTLLLCAIKRGDARLAQERVLDILRMNTNRGTYKKAKAVISGETTWDQARQSYATNDPYNSQGITSIALFELSRGRGDLARQVIDDALPHCAENSGKAILQSLEYGSLARDLKFPLNPPPAAAATPGRHRKWLGCRRGCNRLECGCNRVECRYLPKAMTRTAHHPSLRAVPAFCVAFFLVLCGLAQAAQSVQDAVLTLTTGAWRQDGSEQDHADVFKADGNFSKGIVDPSGGFTAMPGYGGLWIVTGSTVELSYIQWPTRRDTFYLPIDPAGTRGVDEQGHAISMKKLASPVTVLAAKRPRNPAAAAPTPPIPLNVQQAASDAVKAFRGSLLFVTGSEGAGSGFVASIGPLDYLITNVHVAAGITDAAFTSLDGVAVQGGAPSMGVGEDIFRMRYPHAGPHHFTIMQDVQKNVTIGDFVVVLGNAEGAGVVNTLIGRIVGIGPDLVEVDAPFVPGNSGSPIIHLKTGKVIAVATYAMVNPFGSEGFSFFGAPKLRRFGYRLDTVKTWQPVDWPTFKSQAQSVDAIENRTREIELTLMGLAMDGKPMAGSPVDLVNAVSAWRAVAKQKGKWVQKETANESLAAVLQNACQADITAAQSLITYDYFKRAVAHEKAERDQMSAAVWNIIKKMIR